jgi:hypothetical protein
MSTATAAPRTEVMGLERPRRIALVAGVIGLTICALSALFSPMQFFRSYLVAFLFVLGLGLGSLAILMMQYLTGGGWGLVLRRLLETAAQTLPLLAVLFVPLLFGLGYLYSWARPEALDDAVLRGKAPYLNVPFFAARAVLYFVVWIGLAWLLARWSREEDRTGNPRLPRRFRLLSGPGLAFYGLTMTFAAIDWAMSLDPHWYSSIYGVLVAVGQVLTAFCFTIAVVVLVAPRSALSSILEGGILRDLGNLLLAFLMLWAYVAFSQFLLVWSGNLTEEVPWYVARMDDGWQYVGLALIVLHFLLPFLLLLSRDLKQSAGLLASLAGFLLLMRFVDIYYLITPSLSSTSPLPWLWLDVAAVVGLGGVWLAFFLWRLPLLPLLPRHDPRTLEAKHHD